MPSPHPAKRVTCLRTCVSDVPASASVDTWGGDVQGHAGRPAVPLGKEEAGRQGPGRGRRKKESRRGPNSATLRAATTRAKELCPGWRGPRGGTLGCRHVSGGTPAADPFGTCTRPPNGIYWEMEKRKGKTVCEAAFPPHAPPGNVCCAVTFLSWGRINHEESLVAVPCPPTVPSLRPPRLQHALR